jgi:integrating conjugative element relaxase (TIGR03760 family)
MGAEQLIRETRMDGKVESIRAVSGFHNEAFDQLCLPAIHSFAEAVQMMPASQAHHHSGPGGMLVHALEVVEFALRRRKAYLLPQGAQAEDILRLEHLWTYAMFVGALLHDIGKPIADQRVSLILRDGSSRPWTPLAEPMTRQGATHYKVEFVHEDKNYDYHTQVAMTMYPLVVPTLGRDWLAQDRKLMSQLSAWLYGDIYKAGVIGEIVSQADGDSVAANLGIGDRKRLPTAKEVPLVEKLLRSLRYLLVTGKLPLNRDGAAGWVHEGHVWLLVPRVVDAVREDLVTQGHTGIPANNERVFDVWQEHNCLIPSDKGKAVWTVIVDGDGYRHRFTAVKFPLSVLFKPREYPQEMKGRIVVAAEKAPQVPPPPGGEAAQLVSPGKNQEAVTVAASVQPEAVASEPPTGDALEQFSTEGDVAPPPPAAAPVEQVTGAESGEMDIFSQLDRLSGVSTAVDPVPVEIQDSVQPPAQESVAAAAEEPEASPIGDGYYDTVPAPGRVDVEAEGASGGPSSHVLAPVSIKRDEPPSSNVIGKPARVKAAPSEEAIKFMKWVQAGLASGTMAYNESGAVVHFVKEGMLLVSPKIFQAYAGKSEEDWMGIQKRFVKSGWALKAADGKFIWRFQVISGKNATGIMLNGMVVANPGEFINEVPAVNPYLVLFDGALVGD